MFRKVHFNRPHLETPSQTYLEVCLSRPCQVSGCHELPRGLLLEDMGSVSSEQRSGDSTEARLWLHRTVSWDPGPTDSRGPGLPSQGQSHEAALQVQTLWKSRSSDLSHSVRVQRGLQHVPGRHPT